jgi:hypothetical protein
LMYHAVRRFDLAPALRSGSEPPIRPVFSESGEYGPDRFSAREGDFRAIVTPSVDRHHAEVELEVDALEIFEIAEDPLERRTGRTGRHGPAAGSDNALRTPGIAPSRSGAPSAGNVESEMGAPASCPNWIQEPDPRPGDVARASRRAAGKARERSHSGRSGEREQRSQRR